MEKSWLENIHYQISGFSDLEQQKKAWLEFDDTIVSSYSEDLCMLFDSFDFDNFIKEWEREEYNVEILREIIIFRNMLNIYDKKMPNDGKWHDDDVIKDSEWLKVVNQAKNVIDIWKIE